MVTWRQPQPRATWCYLLSFAAPFPGHRQAIQSPGKFPTLEADSQDHQPSNMLSDAVSINICFCYKPKLSGEKKVDDASQNDGVN